MQTSLSWIREPRWLPHLLWQSPLWQGRHLSSGRERAWMSGAETGSASEALWLLPVPEAVSFCSPHPYLHRLVSAESRNQDVSPQMLWQSPPGWAGHLSSFKDGAQMSGAQNGVCPRSCVTSACPRSCEVSVAHSHLSRLVSEGSGTQDGSPRCSGRALPGGHLSSSGEGAWMSGAQNGVCLRSCPLGTLGMSADSLPKVTWCWR